MPEAKPYITGLTPYQPGLPIELIAREYGIDSGRVVKLASNENPLGPSPKALQAVEAAARGMHRYPEQHSLTRALASYYKIDPASVVLGNGSNDVLDLISRAYLGEGDVAVSSQYGFAMYQIATQSAGARNVVVPAREYGHDLEAMRRAITPDTKVLWIANPNNPTGTFIPYDELNRFLAGVDKEIIVVLDEAYYEYLAPGNRADTAAWPATYPNLIIVRTFSKIYGLAGLRIGYGIAASETAALLNSVRQPFNVSADALAGAVAALEDQAFVHKSFRANKAGRRQLLEGLQRLGAHCLPAFGNFITCAVADAPQVCEALLHQGVIVRPLGGYGMPGYLRVTIGTEDENARFLDALAVCMRIS